MQGVGFRPFVHALAKDLGLVGWVRNTAAGLEIEVEGTANAVSDFERRLTAEAPPHARITSLESFRADLVGENTFAILESDPTAGLGALILPDLATCSDCLEEIRDPTDRRYRYPFTNCTRCGPRFSIVERIPYDRVNTTMKGFAMCPECEAEYRDPDNRRFHAQPNACAQCGPQLWLVDSKGNRIAGPDEALIAAAKALSAGSVLAVKGIGGFHLMVDGRDEAAVQRLRERKGRGNKPFAVMYPSLERIEPDCEVFPRERELLVSAAAPIVLVRRRQDSFLPDVLAPGNPWIGVLLPYSPLHHLLLDELNGPVVATSGNLSEEPICFENESALNELGGIADLFLLHDRPIRRPVDDSVVTVAGGREMILRRSRGYAPLPVEVPTGGRSVLAVGADLKNTVAWRRGGMVFLSQHLGDLGTEPSVAAHERSKRDLPELYPDSVDLVAHDLHPDFLSVRGLSRTQGVAVQHHHAHIAACMAEHGLSGNVLGVAWDGTGLGTDGTIWGGEFLVANGEGFERVNWLRGFPLPGGERAIKEPGRTAAGLLHEAGLGREALGGIMELPELRLLCRMLEQGVNSPRTSSMGRLFDGVAALLGLCTNNSFEGEAAMSLEFSSAPAGELEDAWPVPAGRPIDWRPLLRALLDDKAAGVDAKVLATRFHGWLVGVIAQVAQEVGQKTVVLSGGCFQNRVLLEAAVARLRADGFDVYWPQRVPPNDGGIALGQAVIAAPTKPQEQRTKSP